MLENRAPAPRATRVQYRVPACAHTRAALVRTRAALARCAARDDIRRDNVGCCARVHTQDERAHTRAAHCAMLHTIRYPTRRSSAYRHKPLMPLPSDWNKFTVTLASQP